jgi:hypothetical protein
MLRRRLRPQEMSADFGEAIAVIGGMDRKIHFVAWPAHSDACLVAAYPAETTGAFRDANNAAFGFFGGGNGTERVR